nr:UvrD-helicase domain-containing protein [Phycisphaerae bacterium]
MTRRGDRIRWTPQQETAITCGDADVFVGASAGTGKTAVLTGRCARILCDRALCPSVRNIVVVTFTEAAAEEMRSRIHGEVQRRIDADPADLHLADQLLLLPAADISTIHAFCKRLISESFFEIGLDGGFRVIDPDEQSLLKAEALDRTLEWAWDQQGLEQGLEALFAPRRVDGLAHTILDLRAFLEGLVDRQGWYDRVLMAAAQADPFRTPAGLRQTEFVTESLHRLSRRVQWLQGQWDRLGLGPFPGQTLAHALHQGCQWVESGDMDRLVQEIRSVGRPAKPKHEDGDPAWAITQGVCEAASEFTGLAGLAVLCPGYVQAVWPAVQVQVRTYVALARRFDEVYDGLKSGINGLDFADLEHQTLRLLSQPDGRPSRAALALQARARFLFVDEYQDVNPVQQAILEQVCARGAVFGVGDVKQSIYGFRGAEPAIFLDRLRPAGPDAAQGRGGLRVDLTVNFRSNTGVLDVVNRLFGRIMTKDTADLDYDESSRLIPPPDTPRVVGPCVELHILDEPARADPSHQGEAAPVSNRQRQAAVIAQRILRMVGAETGRAEFQVRDPDTGGQRDVQVRDIVILLRSPSARAQEYERILRKAGIPVLSPSVGFLEAMEVQDCLNLLKVLDNPHRDIELAAVLRGPLFGVTDTELAKIRVRGEGRTRRTTFYEDLSAYSRAGEDRGLADKLASVRETLRLWRQRARTSPLAEVIWQVFRDTGLLSLVLALPDGPARRANLLRLHERAIQFDRFGTSQGFSSLGRFVEFVEKLEGEGAQWEAAEPESLRRDAVRIQSVHKSKGLEFPVVILAELDAQFNTRGLSDDVLADPQFLLGLQVVDLDRGVKIPSLEHQVIAAGRRKRDLAEEMRILYVALTRARERLILTGALSRKACTEALAQGRLTADADMAPTVVGRLRTPLEWILYGCHDEPGLVEAFCPDGADPHRRTGRMEVTAYGPSEIGSLSEVVRALRVRAPSGAGLVPGQGEILAHRELARACRSL